MARPIKTGMDYYPSDTDRYNDRKIRKLLNEFGTKGTTIYDYLLCLIYRDNGYWMLYDDETCFDISDFLKSGITEELVRNVIAGCVRYGLFDENLFNVSNILTSSGIQKRYLLAKRNGVIAAGMIVNAAKTGVSTAITPVNAAISTQSKVKESKGKQSKEGEEENLYPRTMPGIETVNPHAPPKQQVIEFFVGQGKSETDAMAFFNYFDALGWAVRGSPVINFRSLANKWIANSKPNQPNVNDMIRALKNNE